MLFDLKKFFIVGKNSEVCSLTVDFSEKDFSGARIKTPFVAKFTAERVGDEIDLFLQAQAVVSANCARCLEEIEQRETVDCEWTVKERDLEDPDFELPLDEKGKLDVEEWLYQEFMFQIPLALICDADCTGLCQICGQKKGTCNCEPEQEDLSPAVDSRLSILKSLLD